MQDALWLVGAGPMAQDYAKVLKAFPVEHAVVGRGEKSAAAFEHATGLAVIRGGLQSALERGPPDTAIVALPVDDLAHNVSQLIAAGVRRLLVEKPGGLTPESVADLATEAEDAGAEVFIAYNRRFMPSTLRARELIAEDGGAQSLRLEFSEFSARIAPLPASAALKANWLYANSTHVLDLGFHLAGFPVEMSCRTQGALDWHPAAAQFAGHGRTERGALFSYHADWMGAPRWLVEITTAKRTIVMQPLESLRFRATTGFEETVINLDHSTDHTCKPGLYLQTKAFLTGGAEADALLPLGVHAGHMNAIYRRIRAGD